MNRQVRLSLPLVALILTGYGRAAAPAEPGISLTPAPGSPMAINAYAVAVADVNSDHHQDLIVTAEHLQIFLGDGSGHFRTAPDFDLDLKGHATELAVGDVNSDGKLDVITGEHEQYSVSVYLGDGTGKFIAAPLSPFWPKRGQHPHTHSLLLCDVNNDKNLDILTANNADNDIAILLGDGHGGFTSGAKSVFPCGPSPYPLAAADVNEDGNIDILIPNSKPDLGTMTVLLGNGKGDFAPTPSSPVKIPAPARDVYYVAATDINGDGHVDVLLDGNHDDCASILLGDGHGNFKPAPQSPLHMGNRGWNVSVVDYDHDGTLDLVSVNEKDIRIHWGDGRGWFKSNPMIVPSGGKGCWKLAIADLNEDGLLDVVTPNVESRDLTILLSRANPNQNKK